MSQSLVHSEWNRMLFQIRCFLARCCAESTLVERHKPQIPVNSMRQTDVNTGRNKNGEKSFFRLFNLFSKSKHYIDTIAELRSRKKPLKRSQRFNRNRLTTVVAIVAIFIANNRYDSYHDSSHAWTFVQKSNCLANQKKRAKNSHLYRNSSLQFLRFSKDCRKKCWFPGANLTNYCNKGATWNLERNPKTQDRH